MKRKSFAEAECPIARALELIGEWWSLLIVRDALFGKRRFGDFQKSLGLAKNILSARLKKLVACGVLEVRPADEAGFNEYLLTPKGRELGMVLLSLRLWGMRWVRDPDGTPRRILDKVSEDEVRLELRTVNGRKLNPLETILVSASSVDSGERQQERATKTN